MIVYCSSTFTSWKGPEAFSDVETLTSFLGISYLTANPLRKYHHHYQEYLFSDFGSLAFVYDRFIESEEREAQMPLL